MTFLKSFSGNKRILASAFLFLALSAGSAMDPAGAASNGAVSRSGMNSLIAVMPMENLTGTPVPIDRVTRSMIGSMKRKGLRILGDDLLQKFLERHRIRYTGGLNRDLGKALREETGADAVLFASLELFDDSSPPKAALTARLVSTGEHADTLWMDSAGKAGNDAPGFLLLGLIDDPRVVLAQAGERVLDSLKGYLSGKARRVPGNPPGKFAPKSFHGVPPQIPAGKRTISVAVIPFRNESTRRNAGEILALHFMREFARAGNFEVLESGEVRQVLLRSRTIMEGGLSLPQADILHAALGVDLVVTGIVTEYQDSTGGWGSPKVEFSARVFDTETRQIVWSSTSFNQGDDGVFFFNRGKVNTAHGVASEMVLSVVEKMHATIGAGMRKGSDANRAGTRGQSG